MGRVSSQRHINLKDYPQNPAISSCQKCLKIPLISNHKIPANGQYFTNRTTCFGCIMINIVILGYNDNGGVRRWFQDAANRELKSNFKVKTINRNRCCQMENYRCGKKYEIGIKGFKGLWGRNQKIVVSRQV